MDVETRKTNNFGNQIQFIHVNLQTCRIYEKKIGAQGYLKTTQRGEKTYILMVTFDFIDKITNTNYRTISNNSDGMVCVNLDR